MNLANALGIKVTEVKASGKSLGVLRVDHDSLVKSVGRSFLRDDQSIRVRIDKYQRRREMPSKTLYRLRRLCETRCCVYLKQNPVVATRYGSATIAAWTRTS